MKKCIAVLAASCLVFAGCASEEKAPENTEMNEEVGTNEDEEEIIEITAEMQENCLEEYKAWLPVQQFGENAKYQLIDIDGNTLPEVLVSEGSEHDNKVKVYTYNPSDGEVVSVGEYGCYGQASFAAGIGIMREYVDGSDGLFHEGFYKLRGTKVESIAKFVFKTDCTQRGVIRREDKNNEYVEGPDYDEFVEGVLQGRIPVVSSWYSMEYSVNDISGIENLNKRLSSDDVMNRVYTKDNTEMSVGQFSSGEGEYIGFYDADGNELWYGISDGFEEYGETGIKFVFEVYGKYEPDKVEVIWTESGAVENPEVEGTDSELDGEYMFSHVVDLVSAG